MKAVLEAEKFVAATSVASDFVPSRPSHPVLACFHVRASPGVEDEPGGELIIKAYDLTKGIEIKIPCTSVDEDFEFCVAAKLIAQYAARLDEGVEMALELFDVEVNMNISAKAKAESEGDEKEEPKGEVEQIMVKNEILTMTSSTGTSVDLSLMPVASFPQLPAPLSDEFTNFNFFEISKCAFSASQDRTKGAIQALQVQTYENGRRVTATDGHRMASSVSDAAALPAGDSGSLVSETLIPAEVVSSIIKVVDSKDSRIEIAKDSEQVFFRSQNFMISSRLMAGVFPNCEALIPADFEYQLELSCKSLVKVLKRIKILADQVNSIVTFKVEDKLLRVSAEAPTMGAADERVPVVYDGEPFSVCFNSNYILDVLENIDDEIVLMKVVNPARPVMFYARHGLDRFLVMPIQRRMDVEVKYTKTRKKSSQKAKAKTKTKPKATSKPKSQETAYDYESDDPDFS